MWHVVRHLRENQNDDVVKDSKPTVGQSHDVLKCLGQERLGHILRYNKTEEAEEDRLAFPEASSVTRLATSQAGRLMKSGLKFEVSGIISCLLHSHKTRLRYASLLISHPKGLNPKYQLGCDLTVVTVSVSADCWLYLTERLRKFRARLRKSVKPENMRCRDDLLCTICDVSHTKFRSSDLPLTGIPSVVVRHSTGYCLMSPLIAQTRQFKQTADTLRSAKSCGTAVTHGIRNDSYAPSVLYSPVEAFSEVTMWLCERLVDHGLAMHLTRGGGHSNARAGREPQRVLAGKNR